MVNKAAAQVPEILVPKDIVIQHAGSIGFFSVGIGYPVFKNKRGSLDFNYGYVPESRGGQLHILSAKFAYRPFKIQLAEGVSLFPVNPGAFFTYHFGKQFDFYWDKDTYEDGYYWWSTALRPHLSLSTEVKLDALKVFKTSKIKGISLYSEFNTNELYLTSYYKNAGSISLADIFKLGVGIRVHL
ncbi:hypothetical protein [Pedobacter sp.]|uniref:hypothetical protein n=1 Tax=Pedobacter sp. TaxID=1411316 RepID=UPI003D7F5CC4